jgi:hypothetical protein
MWIGSAGEVMKLEFPQAIERGVPFEAAGLFTDLFLDDPLYVLVDEAAAREMLGKLKAAEGDREKTLALKEANVADMAVAAKLKLKDWYANRNALRALVAKPAPVLGAPAPEPGPRVMPKKGGGN